MRKTLDDPKEQELRIYSIPFSGIRIDNQKINYFDFLSSRSNADCNEAIKRIVPKIDLDKIDHIIENAPLITTIQKEFYRVMLHERKVRILDYTLSLIKRNEQEP